MNLKWLFWTGLLAITVFFGAIYLGMKYGWMSGSTPSPATSLSKKPPVTQPSVETKSSEPMAAGNGINPELVDEADEQDEKILDSSGLTIEEVVSQCQNLSQSIGVPELKLEQAISECVDRNSKHLTEEGLSTDKRGTLIREQCNAAITQKELLSNEEIKMLVDECVASMG